MMIIHSIVPMEMLVTPYPTQPTQIKEFSQGFVEGISAENGLTITRVISTDPSVYLDKNFQVGSIYK